jgi:hypothetical protein
MSRGIRQANWLEEVVGEKVNDFLHRNANKNSTGVCKGLLSEQAVQEANNKDNKTRDKINTH